MGMLETRQPAVSHSCVPSTKLMLSGTGGPHHTSTPRRRYAWVLYAFPSPHPCRLLTILRDSFSASHSSKPTTLSKASRTKSSASSCSCPSFFPSSQFATHTECHSSQSSNLVPQSLPSFVLHRSIYEAREQPSKTYHWAIFILSSILIEIPYQTLMSVLIFSTWYYPMALYRNTRFMDAGLENGVLESGIAVGRQVMMWAFIWVYMLFVSTFGIMVQAGVELAEMGGNYANLGFMMSLIFCGFVLHSFLISPLVPLFSFLPDSPSISLPFLSWQWDENQANTKSVLVSPSSLPNFWIFMYRLSPFTYLISGIASVGLANAPVTCSSIELLHFSPIANQTCGEYMAPYIHSAGGYLVNSAEMADCAYCPVSDTNALLGLVGIEYGDRWRDFGIMWVYVVVDVVGALFFYWLIRVPKKSWRRVEKIAGSAAVVGEGAGRPCKEAGMCVDVEEKG